jgi:hypothetical protein
VYTKYPTIGRIIDHNPNHFVGLPLAEQGLIAINDDQITVAGDFPARSRTVGADP